MDTKTDKITQLLTLAARMPSGLPDTRAFAKLEGELAEFWQTPATDLIGQQMEAAGVAYYCAKLLHLLAHASGLTVDAVLDTALAKYEFRALPGNPKDDQVERGLAQQVLDRHGLSA